MAQWSHDSEAKHAFAILKPLCTQLLELPLAKPDSSSPLLESLARALHDAPLAGLRVCMDYVLFPLQLLLDAAVNCRSSRASASVDAMRTQNTGVTQFPISDRIAEGVLSCLEELLHRCPMKTTSQMSLLLGKLTAAAMLSPDEASEEFRHGAVKCLKEVLLALMPCNRLSCSCRLSTLPPSITHCQGYLKPDLEFIPDIKTETRVRDAVEDVAESNEECLIDFLRSEDMLAAIGHLMSLFLQIAETEALRGGRGSAKLRIDALSTFRALLLKVGTADALAFFLPGIASRLVKAMRSSKTMNGYSKEVPSQPSYPTGAAGSSGAVEEGMRGLAELLVLVLADERNLYALEDVHLGLNSAITKGEKYSLKGELKSAESTLASLCELVVQLKDTNESQVALNARSKLNESDGGEAAEKVESSRSSCIQGPREEMPEGVRSFRTERNKEWLEQTAIRVNTLLSHSFPAICGHPVPSVRLAVSESATMLLMTCGHTLEGSRSMLLECLLAMACDDWPHVASAAHTSLAFLVTQLPQAQGFLRDVKEDIRKVICRLVERLPKAVFSADETVTVLLCRQLLAAMFFAGPEGVSHCLFHSPAAVTQFATVMKQCLSFNSTFAGSIGQLMLGKVDPLGYIRGISELHACKNDEKNSEQTLTPNSANMTCKGESSQAIDKTDQILEGESEFQELPRMPPWLAQAGGSKFYHELSGILRLAGLSSVSGCDDARYLFVLIETILAPLRQMPSQLHREEYINEKWHDWNMHGGGQWQRSAATAASVLNEIIYGASGHWIHKPSSLFGGLNCSKQMKRPDQKEFQKVYNGMDNHTKIHASLWAQWEGLGQSQPCKLLTECVGDILHDYMSTEIWELPIDATTDSLDQASIDSLIPLHVLRDNAALQQVILEGIGVFGISLGKCFEEQGFLGSVLYLLLEKLGCTDYQVSSSADIALHAIPSPCCYPSVKSLVMANADHIIDSLCRQLRHLDLHPSAPNMLVAVLRYTGAGQDFLHLLQEPMRSISLELEIPARQYRPGNTVPMLRALREIVKVAKGECSSMLTKTSEFIPMYEALAGKIKERNHVENQEIDDANTDESHMWDEVISKLKERQRCRQSVEDVVISCLNACAPLMSSKEHRTCLLALDIVEEGMDALSCMDVVAKHEKEQREAIIKLVNHTDEMASFDDMETPKLLPTMHRVWPHLVACLKQSAPSVLIQSLRVIASVVCSCGGEFFTRRFQKDAAPHMLTLLCRGTALQTRSEGVQQGLKNRILFSHVRGDNLSAQEQPSPASVLKVQAAVLSCITSIARNKNSAPALLGALNCLAAIAVGLACGVLGLQDYAAEALLALSNIDADLIWLLVADIAHGSISQQTRKEKSPGLDFPEISHLLPPLSSAKEALWMQLAGKDCSLNIDGSKAWSLLSRIESSK